MRRGAPADHDRFDLGQIAFLVIGEAQIKLFAGNHTQDRVPEELETLIGGQAGVGT